MSIEIQHNINLAQYATLKVGGAALNFISIQTEEQLTEAVLFAQAEGLEIKILGGGSNVLITDDAVQGLVIKIDIKGIAHEANNEWVRLTVGAGETLDDVVAYAVKNNWWGLENLSHIPGTVGATPVQNVGAYGVEVKDCIETVKVFNTDTKTFETLTTEECKFGYRDSIFKKVEGAKYIVTEVTYGLSAEPKPQVSYRDLHNLFAEKEPTLLEIRNAVIEIRAGKFPNWHEVGTAGSFFKNPIISTQKYEALHTEYPDIPAFPADSTSVKIPLGWVLDKILQYKGVQTGAVGTYKGQALVLINTGGATAQEIENFANDVVQKVKEKIDVEVEWEVTKFL